MRCISFHLLLLLSGLCQSWPVAWTCYTSFWSFESCISIEGTLIWVMLRAIQVLLEYRSLNSILDWKTISSSSIEILLLLLFNSVLKWWILIHDPLDILFYWLLLLWIDLSLSALFRIKLITGIVCRLSHTILLIDFLSKIYLLSLRFIEIWILLRTININVLSYRLFTTRSLWRVLGGCFWKLIFDLGRVRCDMRSIMKSMGYFDILSKIQTILNFSLMCAVVHIFDNQFILRLIWFFFNRN